MRTVQTLETEAGSIADLATGGGFASLLPLHPRICFFSYVDGEGGGLVNGV